MANSKATRAEDYIQELPIDRRQVIASVRDLINEHLPEGYEEIMASGMISWVIPLSRYPVTYNQQPLACVALAAQKNNYALYLMSAAMSSEDDVILRDAYKAAGKRLDMGKSCLRFRQREDLLDAAIARLISSTSVEKAIARYEASRSQA